MKPLINATLFLCFLPATNIPGSTIRCQGETPALIATVPEAVLRRAATAVVMPKYPTASIKNKKSGVAVANVQVDDKGKIVKVEAIQSPDEEIGRSVVVAIKRWKFSPSSGEGKPLQLRGKLTFYFLLDDGKPRVENPRKFAEKSSN